MGDTVFLCHNRADTEQVQALAVRLKADGIGVWLDIWNLIPGERFTPKIMAALEECTAIAVFLGPTGSSPYQNLEVETVISDRFQKGMRLIPVLLPGASDEAITGALKTVVRVRFQTSIAEAEAFRLLVCGVRGILPGPGAAPGETPRRLDDRSPYRGLAAFGVDDWELFFGRSRITAEAVDKVQTLLAAGKTRCLSIVGGSGTGKSSLARAGVVHALLAQHADWRTVILEPAGQPLDVLAERMLKLTQPQVDALTLKNHAAEYLADSSMLQRAVFGAFGSDPSTGRLLLLVDQFEEIFTLCEGKKTREAFIGNLLSAARDPAGKTVLLLCIRADFYEDCAKTELADVLASQQVLVGPMRGDELAEAIREPAVRVGCDVEPALVACLVRDCEEQPSPLPLLQIVLEKLWEKRDSHGKLALAEYEKMSLEGAIDAHAEGIFNRLPEDQKKPCLSLFLQLVERLSDGRYARRRVAVESVLPDPGPGPAGFERVKNVQALIGLLAGQSARLIAIRSEGGVAQLEIAHEATFRGWKRLAAQLDRDSEFLLWKRRLDTEIGDSAGGNTRGALLSGTLLDRALTWLKERPEDHTREERDYIRASRLHRWRQRGFWAAATGAMLAVLVLGTGRLLRTRTQLDLQRRMDDAIAAAKTNPPLAVVLAIDLARRTAGRQAQELLQEAVQAAQDGPLLEYNEPLADFSVRADGKAVAAATNGAILLWKPLEGTGPVWSPDHISDPRQFAFPGRPLHVALTADGSLVAAGDDTGRVMAWSAADSSQALPHLPPFPSAIAGMAFSTDGHLAVITKSDGAFWCMPSKGSVDGHVSLPSQPRSVAVTPAGSEVAIGTSDGTLRFWKPPASSLETRALQHDEPTVTDAVYARGGAILATGTLQGKGYFWQAPFAGMPRRFQSANQRVSATALSGDGRRIATGTYDGTLVAWDTAAGGDRFTFRYGPQDLLKIVLNQDGTRLMALAGGAAPGVRIYELELRELQQTAEYLVRHTPAAALADCGHYLDPAACATYGEMAEK
jgi:hypothetical protein